MAFGRNKVEWMHVVERVHISASADTVWRFVASAQAIPLYMGALRGYADPDSPVGEVGERQCIEYLRGGQLVTEVIEVIELTPGQRAVTTYVEPADPPTRGTTEVMPDPDGGCWLSEGYSIAIPRQQVGTAEREVLKPARAGLRAIQALQKARIEEGWTLPEWRA